MDYLSAKKIMGRNLIGPAQLNRIKDRLQIATINPNSTPSIPFTAKQLKNCQHDFLLILGTDKTKAGQLLTINELRKIFGYNPDRAQPCFYNQDWYLKERFASKTVLAKHWYLIKKTVAGKSRGKPITELKKKLPAGQKLPSAVLTAYAFFACWLVNREKLWPNDFVWCADTDHNGDQIYTGRYFDPNKTNKNGFNIHRHLSIKKNYGLAPQIL